MWNDQEAPRALVCISEVRLARKTDSHEAEKESYVMFISSKIKIPSPTKSDRE